MPSPNMTFCRSKQPRTIIDASSIQERLNEQKHPAVRDLVLLQRAASACCLSMEQKAVQLKVQLFIGHRPKYGHGWVDIPATPRSCAGRGFFCEWMFTRSSTSSADRMATTDAPRKMWSDMSWMGNADTTPTLVSSQYTPAPLDSSVKSTATQNAIFEVHRAEPTV